MSSSWDGIRTFGFLICNKIKYHGKILNEREEKNGRGGRKEIKTVNTAVT